MLLQMTETFLNRLESLIVIIVYVIQLKRNDLLVVQLFILRNPISIKQINSAPTKAFDM
jgi:hypothetical protein